MSDQEKEGKISRRRFLGGAAAVGALAAGSILEACAPGAASPTAAPAAATPAAKAGTTPAAAGASPAAAAPTVVSKGGPPIKIGFMYPQTGVYAGTGAAMVEGFKLGLEQAGMAAGGRPIQLVEGDEGDPQPSLQTLRKLIESDKVDIAGGLIRSDVALAIRDLVDQSKLPFVITNAGAHEVTGDRKSAYIYRVSFANAQPAYGLGGWVYQNVAKEAVTAAADYAAGKNSVEGFQASFEKAGGKLIQQLWPPFPGTDYATYITQIQQIKPPATYHFFAGADAVKFIKQAAEFGLTKETKVTCAGFMCEEDVLPAVGEAALGIISGLHYAMLLDNPLNKEFVKQYTDKYKKDPSVYSVQGYDGAKLMVETINKLQGDVSNREKVAQTMGTMKLDSPRGPIEFADNHELIQNVYIRQVEMVDGKPHNKVIATIAKVQWPPK